MKGIEAGRREDDSNLAAQLEENRILISLEGDLDEDGQFGHRTLQVTSDTVRTLEPSGAVSFQIPIADVKSARKEPLVRGGRLEVTTKRGEINPTASLTAAHAALVSE